MKKNSYNMQYKNKELKRIYSRKRRSFSFEKIRKNRMLPSFQSCCDSWDIKYRVSLWSSLIQGSKHLHKRYSKSFDGYSAASSYYKGSKILFILGFRLKYKVHTEELNYVNHIISSFVILAQKKYKRWMKFSHNIHWLQPTFRKNRMRLNVNF